MVQQMSLRGVADSLEIESWRVLRLGRFLNLNCYELLMPRDEVERMRLLHNPDDRYMMLREWLLHHVPQSH